MYDNDIDMAMNDLENLRFAIGFVFIVASILKLATLGGILHISWLEREAESPWATYGIPLMLIIVGADLIRQSMKYK